MKMMLLSQLVYFCQNFLIYLTKNYFIRLGDSVILHFIWNYKPHRIRKDQFCKRMREGWHYLISFCIYYGSTVSCSGFHWIDENFLDGKR